LISLTTASFLRRWLLTFDIYYLLYRFTKKAAPKKHRRGLKNKLLKMFPRQALKKLFKNYIGFKPKLAFSGY
jgi:hypothetical protein